MKKYIEYVFHLIALSLILGCAYANLFVGVAIGTFMFIGLFINTINRVETLERKVTSNTKSHQDMLAYLTAELGGTLVQDALIKHSKNFI